MPNVAAASVPTPQGSPMTDDRDLAGIAASPATRPAVAAGVGRAALAIGPARPSELLSLARLQGRAFRPRLAYGLGTVVALWLLPHVRFLVARLDGRVVGCAIGDRDNGNSRVINLAVDPDARRQGIGRALLRALEAALPKGDVLLMVEEENAGARALYEAEGYHRVGFARDYYGRGHHGIWMQKRRTAKAAPAVRV